MLQQLNHSLFLFIHEGWLFHEYFIALAHFCSEYLSTIAGIVLLGLAVVLRRQYVALFFKSLFVIAIAFWLDSIFNDYLHVSRPFAIGLGENWANHSNNNSFPSSHMLIISAAAFSYIFSSKPKLGYGLLIVAFLVGWSRIYLGAHFPFDIFAALSIALLINIVVNVLWKSYNYQQLNKGHSSTE